MKQPSVRIGSHYRIRRAVLAKFLGVDESDVISLRERRREEVDALLGRYCVAREVSRVTSRMLQLDVLVTVPSSAGRGGVRARSGKPMVYRRPREQEGHTGEDGVIDTMTRLRYPNCVQSAEN